MGLYQAVAVEEGCFARSSGKGRFVLVERSTSGAFASIFDWDLSLP